jgi:hypothetical protein
MLQAINPKNQARVNKAVNYLTKHNELNDQRDQVAGEHGEDSRLWAVVNRQCARFFDKFETALADLPKYEQKSILNSNLY